MKSESGKTPLEILVKLAVLIIIGGVIVAMLYSDLSRDTEKTEDNTQITSENETNEVNEIY